MRYRHLLKSITCLMTGLIPLSVCSAPLPVKFPTTDNNVAYSKVTALPFTPASETISYGDAPLQYAMLWRADSIKTQSAAPLVILIHGGCWLNAYDIKHTYALSTGLAQAGFNVWSIEYRRTGDEGGGWPGSYEDIKSGIAAAAVFNNKEFDLAESVLIGHSAGGQLALLAGGEIKDVAGVIGLAAITDIEAYSLGTNGCQQATGDFMGGTVTERESAYHLANPSKQPLHARTYLLQGTADSIVPPADLHKLNRPIVMSEGAGHFDWIHPGSGAFDTLLSQLVSLTKK